jgi:hypothetical protein
MDEGMTCLDRLDGLEIEQYFVSPARYYIQVPAGVLVGIAKSPEGATLASFGDSNVLRSGEAGWADSQRQGNAYHLDFRWSEA